MQRTERPTRRDFIHSLALTGALPLTARAQGQPPAGQAAGARTVVARGRVVCLTEELASGYQIAPDCDKRGHGYSLKTADGKILSFLPTDTAAAVWDDARIRERELQVTAREITGTSFIEVIKLQSVKGGKVYDLYYYCDVCAITTHKPGPCACCQDPVVFHETPAEERSHP
jgi:hypothetical protein